MPRDTGADANVGSTAIRKQLLSWLQETGMPETEHDARSKEGLPSVVRRNNGVHERKETRRFVKYLHIDIEYNMSILRLKKSLPLPKLQKRE